jgi:hypothetical protein
MKVAWLLISLVACSGAPDAGDAEAAEASRPGINESLDPPQQPSGSDEPAVAVIGTSTRHAGQLDLGLAFNPPFDPAVHPGSPESLALEISGAPQRDLLYAAIGSCDQPYFELATPEPGTTDGWVGRSQLYGHQGITCSLPANESRRVFLPLPMTQAPHRFTFVFWAVDDPDRQVIEVSCVWSP